MAERKRCDCRGIRKNVFMDTPESRKAPVMKEHSCRDFKGEADQDGRAEFGRVCKMDNLKSKAIDR